MLSFDRMPSILSTAEAIRVASNAKVIAVLGIKTVAQASQPAYFVPEYLSKCPGVKIIPVPVYYPDVREILGEPVIRDLKQINTQVDILDVFRPPAALDDALLRDILSMDPRPVVVWLQKGIRNESFEKSLLDNGIDLVVDRCLKVDKQMSRL